MAQAQQDPQARQQEQMQMLYEKTRRTIALYQQSPEVFSPDQLKTLKKAADAFGIPFEVPFNTGRAIKKGLYELGEGLTLGLLPNSMDPGAMNAGETIAGGVGGILGLAAPVGLGIKGAGFAAKLVGRAARGQSLTAGALTRYLATTPPAVRKYLEGGAAAASKVAQSSAVRKLSRQAMTLAATHPTAFKLAFGGPIFLATKNMFGGTEDEGVMEPGLEPQQ